MIRNQVGGRSKMPPRFSKLGVNSDRNHSKKSRSNERQKRRKRMNKQQQFKTSPLTAINQLSNISDTSLTSNQKAFFYRRRLKNLLEYEKAVRQACNFNTITSYCTDEKGQYKECEEAPSTYYCNRNDADDGSYYDDPNDDGIKYCTCDENSQDQDNDKDDFYCCCDDSKLIDEKNDVSNNN